MLINKFTQQQYLNLLSHSYTNKSWSKKQMKRILFLKIDSMYHSHISFESDLRDFTAESTRSIPYSTVSFVQPWDWNSDKRVRTFLGTAIWEEFWKMYSPPSFSPSPIILYCSNSYMKQKVDTIHVTPHDWIIDSAALCWFNTRKCVMYSLFHIRPHLH